MTATKDRRASRKPTSRRLLDYLESRVLLDGNVLASVSAGTLTLQGDNLNNSVIIDQAALSSSQFRLSSGDGITTINGTTSPQTFDDVTNIVINAGSGNDTLTLQNASVAGSVQINGANGNQAVDLNTLTVAGDFSLTNTGGQNSTTVENATIQGNVIISAGLAFDPTSGTLWASPLFANANQIFTLSNSTVDNAVLISNGSSETTTTIDNNSTINTDLLLSNGNLSYGSMGFNSGNSPSPAGDLFILNASTVGDSISITNATNGNAAIIEGGSSVTNNLTVTNTGDADCGCMLPGSSDSFTLTDSSSINGDVTLSNTSNGSSILITNFGFIGGSLNVTNTAAAADCPCYTLNYGQPTPAFGDYLTLSDGAFVGADVNISNGSTYNSTDVDSNFIGGNLTLSNGPDFTAATYTTDLFTLNDGFVGGSVAISNAAGDINTTISNTIISVSLSVTNLNGNTFFENTSSTDPTNYQDTEQTAPVPPPPPPLAITTTQEPATATIGSSIADQATLTGGCDPTGTVTFTLFSNATAAGTPLFTDTETLSNGIATSAAYTTTATGTDYWVATYNGDCMNMPLSTGPADEPVTVNAATPLISTTQQPATITVGNSIADQATVTNGFNPAGTVTFQLFNNPTATGAALFTDTESLSNGTTTSASFTTTAAGTDYWVATYNGDTNNNPVTSTLAGEPVTIAQATPLITTTQQPATITIGNSIADKATVTAGFNPTGTITFQLYNNPNATGAALFTDTETLSGGTATSANFTTTAPGTDYWVATYNGNTNNNSVTSSTAAEPVTVNQATPSIATTQQPATITVGGSIADQATVTNGFNPTGTITFQLFNNPNATGTALFTDTEALSNGTATSASFTTTAPGTDYWVATYNGNTNNKSVTSATAAEPVTINQATPLIATTQQPTTTTVGGSIADKATITAGFNPTGTVTFQLFNNPNATGAALFTDTESLSNGTATSASYTTPTTGTDYWVATYNGNSNNVSVTSATAAEPVTVNQATPSISTTQQPATITVGNSIADKATLTAGFNPTGTITFQLYNNPNATGAALFTNTEALSGGTATSATYTTTATGTDYWVATYNGNANNLSVTSATAAEPVTVNQATPLITTTQQPATITVGGSIADQATVTNGFNPTGTGTITFQLYNNPTATGPALFTDTEALSGNTATSASYTTTATGTDYWLATYNGNSNNVSVTSGAAGEPVTVTGMPMLTLTKTADQASITVGQTAGYVLTITNSGTATATGLTLSDPLPAGAGNDVIWTIDNHIDNPAAFTITGAVGSQVLSLQGQPVSLAVGASLSVHITGVTSVNDSLTSTNPALNVGGISAYTVLYEGTGNNQLSISNDTINGNIGVGGGQVQFNGPGTIVGRLDFSGPNTSQYHNTNGSNVGPTSINYSAAAVTTAINAVNSLSTSLGALAGTNISFNNANQTVNESSGTLHTSNGVTYRVFNVTSYSENNSDTVTINGDGSGDPVVFNFAYSSNTNLGSKIALTGGLSDDQVMWNFTSSGKQVQLNNNGGTYIGVIIAPNDQYQSDSSNLYGRVYGGTAGNMQIVSGANVYAPPMTGTLSNTATVSASNVSTVNASATITIQPAPGATTNAVFNASLSGTVFNDVNKNGNIDAGDTGIAGVQLTLTGVNDLGISVTLVTTTNASGAFSFANLRAGTYTLTETQPAGYSTTKDVAGTAGGSVQNDTISNIVLKSGVLATGYNFGEH